MNTCKTGKYQSPIEFDEEEAQETLKNVDFEYEEFVPVTVSYARNEAEVTGEFGHMNFANAEGEKIKYSAYKIVFKFPAEHIVNDEPHAGEMQVWHTTETRQTAVVSFFIDEEDDHDNAFFMDLSPPFWDVSGAYKVPRASLNLAAKGGIK